MKLKEEVEKFSMKVNKICVQKNNQISINVYSLNDKLELYISIKNI